MGTSGSITAAHEHSNVVVTELAEGDVFGDHAVILLCGKLLCLFVSWLCTVAVQWFCLFPCIALFLLMAKDCA